MNKKGQILKSEHQAGLEQRALQNYYWKYEYSGMDMPYAHGPYACGTFKDSKENVYSRSKRQDIFWLKTSDNCTKKQCNIQIITLK